jgi:uncharacterized membrane protein YraQ (UPF0718 family)
MQSLLLEIIFLFVAMAPYLMFGLLIAGCIHELFPEKKVLKHLGAGSSFPEIKASLLGVPLPLCSCAVIPTSLSLKKLGAKDSAVVSFLTATPQTGVDSIFVSAMILGPVMTVFRVLSTFFMGISGGYLVKFFGADYGVPAEKSCCQKESSDTAQPVPFFTRVKNIFRYGFVTMISDIGAWLLLGIVLGGLISWMLPEDFFSRQWIFGGFSTMLLMILVGIPLYICATASIPIAAALMFKGLSAGAAFVFLTAGSATNIASLLVLFKTLGKKNTFLYLLNIVVMSIVCGLLLDALQPIFPVVLPEIKSPQHDCLSPISIVLSILFALLMAWNILLPRKN